MLLLQNCDYHQPGVIVGSVSVVSVPVVSVSAVVVSAFVVAVSAKYRPWWMP